MDKSVITRPSKETFSWPKINYLFFSVNKTLEAIKGILKRRKDEYQPALGEAGVLLNVKMKNGNIKRVNFNMEDKTKTTYTNAPVTDQQEILNEIERKYKSKSEGKSYR